MSENLSKPATAFEGHRLLLSGPLADVALAVKMAAERNGDEPILVFEDATGRVVDLDLRGSRADILDRLAQIPPSKAEGPASGAVAKPEPDVGGQRGRGRPKLGVIAREVTLLPRQWEWLAAQPGGASAVLRRLVDEARRTGGAARQRRTAQEAAYSVMSAIAGDLPFYEEATRALFSGNSQKLGEHMSDWPPDIHAYVMRLAGAAPA